MIITLFVMGMLTSLGCGVNVVSVNNATWKHELIWIIGGVVGALMMGFAVWLDHT